VVAKDIFVWVLKMWLIVTNTQSQSAPLKLSYLTYSETAFYTALFSVMQSVE